MFWAGYPLGGQSQAWVGRGLSSVNRVALSAGASQGHCGSRRFLLPSLACLYQEVPPGAKEDVLAGSPILGLRLSPWWVHKRPDHFSCLVLAQWSHLHPLSHQPGSQAFAPEPSTPPWVGSPELGLIPVPPAHLPASFSGRHGSHALVPALVPLLQA